jgi:glutathione S-transferase
MKLYEFALTRSIRARWTLQELGVDFEPISVNLFVGEGSRPEFLKLNPARPEAPKRIVQLRAALGGN